MKHNVHSLPSRYKKSRKINKKISNRIKLNNEALEKVKNNK